MYVWGPPYGRQSRGASSNNFIDQSNIRDGSTRTPSHHSQERERRKAKQNNIVNFFYSAHCRNLELVSSLARVCNNGSFFQSNICNVFLAWDLAAVHIVKVSVIAGCLQGESWL